MVLALLGLLGLWEAQGDGWIPAMMPLRTIDPRAVSAPHCAVPGIGDEARWQGLAAALSILDQVNPQVATWLRQKHEQGRVVFSDSYRAEGNKHGSLAEYDHVRRALVVHRMLFEENDGEVAAILCHEYRHSRQNLARVFKCALSFVVTADGDRSIVENDALLYEREARDAIFAKEMGDLIVGNSPAMQEVYKAIGRVAEQDVSVLIEGESGTSRP
jgi:transcriptional regulator with GAF, ATPase, and Fis domain